MHEQSMNKHYGAKCVKQTNNDQNMLQVNMAPQSLVLIRIQMSEKKKCPRELSREIAKQKVFQHKKFRLFEENFKNKGDKNHFQKQLKHSKINLVLSKSD